MFWVFKLSFVVDILAFYLTWQLFVLFFEKFGDFFLIIWSLCCGPALCLNRYSAKLQVQNAAQTTFRFSPTFLCPFCFVF
jgi:hypothetical protein